ncbi:MAG: alpha/beta fold hydrolase [Oligoflexia bacterium]|nr:alpha/beta fold hydrolase [Oligoflexia bacterium]
MKIEKLECQDGVILSLELSLISDISDGSIHGDGDWLVFTHGIGEHLGRHRYLLKLFSKKFNIALYDLRGHGRSGGQRADIQNFRQFSDDLREILVFLRKKYKMKSYMLLAHSMGCLVTADFLQDLISKKEAGFVSTGESAFDQLPQRVFLCAPPVGFANVVAKFLKRFSSVTNFLSKIPIAVPLKETINLYGLSHDLSVYSEYKDDPLNSECLSSRLLLNLISASGRVFSLPIGLMRQLIPLGVAQGDADDVVDAALTEIYFKRVEPASELKIIRGGYHELHNEISSYREQYFAFLQNFISP